MNMVKLRNLELLRMNFGHLHFLSMRPVLDCSIFCIEPPVLECGAEFT